MIMDVPPLFGCCVDAGRQKSAPSAPGHGLIGICGFVMNRHFGAGIYRYHKMKSGNMQEGKEPYFLHPVRG